MIEAADLFARAINAIAAIIGEVRDHHQLFSKKNRRVRSSVHQ
jgi:hypothetical protein